MTKKKTKEKKLYPKEKKLTDKQWETRIAAENDLETFVKLVAPYRVLGHIHLELFEWWSREEAKSHQMVLLPRDHQKSAMIAYRCAQRIVKNPDVRILYLSSTSGLAEKQLKMIKDILTSKAVTKYWPDLLFVEEGKREKWTNTEICVDHPLRKEEGVRDSTVFIGGLTTSLTGLHCDVAVLDDLVVKENAYNREGRNKVQEQYSLLASIEGTDSEEWVVGTRYDPSDLYNDLKEMKEEVANDKGEVLGNIPVYEVFQREVEDEGNGYGEFLWPRQQRSDGKWFGFNSKILAKKKAKYLDRRQFYSQYYNNPHDPESNNIDVSKFQYYDKKFLTESKGSWYFKHNKLNIFAAIDFAFSRSKKADFTCIVVIGMDCEGNIFILDIYRFKTDANIADYYRYILKAHITWNIRKLRAEVTVAQKAIVKEIKNQYLKPQGIVLSIDEFNPTRHLGSKEERIASILDARYDNQVIWHYRGGHCQLLEEELILDRPPHDDIKDSLASAIDIAKPPSSGRRHTSPDGSNNVLQYHSRFGGVQT